MLTLDFSAGVDYSEVSLDEFNLSICDCARPLDLSKVPHWVRYLHLQGCDGLTSMHGLGEQIKTLSVIDCPNVVSLVGLPDSLFGLRLERLLTLQWQPELLPSQLCTLHLKEITSVDHVRGLPPNLRCLKLNELPHLQSLVGLTDITRTVIISGMDRAFDLSVLSADLGWLVVGGRSTGQFLPYRPSLRALRLDHGHRLPVQMPDGSQPLVGSIGDYLKLIRKHQSRE